MELGREQKIEQLERVLHSRALQNSENLKAFLRFVVEKTLAKEDAQLKEYTIAIEVLAAEATTIRASIRWYGFKPEGYGLNYRSITPRKEKTTRS